MKWALRNLWDTLIRDYGDDPDLWKLVLEQAHEWQRDHAAAADGSPPPLPAVVHRVMRADEVRSGMLIPARRSSQDPHHPSALVTAAGPCEEGWPSRWVAITTCQDGGEMVRVQRLPPDWLVEVLPEFREEAA